MDDLISEFIGETTESLTALRRELARAPVSHDTWEQAYKLVHTIKGTCGFLGLKRLEHVAGSTELLLHDIRDGRTYASAPVIAVVGEAVSKLDAIVAHLAQYGSEPPGDDRALLAQLQNLPEEAPPPMPAPEPAKVLVEEERMEMPRLVPTEALPPLPSMNNLPATRVEIPKQKPQAAPAPKPRSANPELYTRVLSGMVSVRNQLKTLAIASNTNRLDGMIGKLTGLVRAVKRETGAEEIKQVMVIDSGGQRFAFLQDEIAEVMKIREAQMSESDMPMLRHQGSWLPIKSLRGVLGRGTNNEELYAIVLRAGKQRFALAVEQLGLLEEVQVAAWPPLMRDVPLYHGATLLGDNSICLVMSANGIMQTSGARYEPPARPQPIGMDVPLVFAPEPNLENEPAPADDMPAHSSTAYLLFDAGDALQKALPLYEVLRVENARGEDVTHPNGTAMIEYRGQWLRLLSLPGNTPPVSGHFQIILLNASPDAALVARATAGIAHETAPPAPGMAQPPYLGRMVLSGKMTDVVDVRALIAAQREAA